MNEPCALLAPVERPQTFSQAEVWEFIERASQASFAAGYRSGLMVGMEMGAGLVAWEPQRSSN